MNRNPRDIACQARRQDSCRQNFCRQEICRQLESWYEGEGGRYLLARERQLVAARLRGVPWNFLLQLGASAAQPLAPADSPGHVTYIAAQAGGTPAPAGHIPAQSNTEVSNTAARAGGTQAQTAQTPAQSNAVAPSAAAGADPASAQSNADAPSAAARAGGANLISAPESLPLPDDCMDAVLLHHALEFSPDPHALLREAHRVLAPQGHLLVVGFNPCSVLGLGNRLRGLCGLWRGSLWRQSRNIGTGRLRDWLRLLGARVQRVDHSYGLAPLWGEGLSRRLNAGRGLALRLGGVYVMHARKQVVALTPQRQRWRPNIGAIIDLTVPRPVPSPRAPGRIGFRQELRSGFRRGFRREAPAAIHALARPHIAGSIAA